MKKRSMSKREKVFWGGCWFLAAAGLSFYLSAGHKLPEQLVSYFWLMLGVTLGGLATLLFTPTGD